MSGPAVTRIVCAQCRQPVETGAGPEGLALCARCACLTAVPGTARLTLVTLLQKPLDAGLATIALSVEFRRRY